MNWSRDFLVCGMLLLLAACNQVAAPTMSSETSPQPAATLSIDDTLTPESQMSDTQMTQPAQPSPSPGMQILIEKAREDLAQRLSISVAQINLVEAKEVVWPDASLGCPQPGMAYAEVLTPGYLILLKADNKEYEYHASKGTEVVYCENPMPPIPGTSESI